MGVADLKSVGSRYGDGVCCMERPAMIKGKNVVAELRRDAAYVLHAAIAVVFIGFAVLAIAAAVYDLLPVRH